ncbi:MAG TPA: hydroxyisourate hydrolase [Aestuariivirga sp.]|nr:hydroxyisourate hydrolase [Aestuariivirga sp.]
MGRLTTHVLDTATGSPAAGMKIELYLLDGGSLLMKTLHTNGDGRADGPVLEGTAFMQGHYELRYHAGDYWRGQGVKIPEPAFFDVIPIRFGIANASQHYHVPLLLSPYGYSTYRGS